MDLFAGTGAVSIEFISRGAREVTSIDINNACTEFIKSTVNTIGLSRRLSLFRQQALRPYKTALWLLGILLLLAIGLGTFFIIRGNNINKQLRLDDLPLTVALCGETKREDYSRVREFFNDVALYTGHNFAMSTDDLRRAPIYRYALTLS